MSCKTLEGRELPTGPNSNNQIGYKTCEMISPNNGPPRNDSSLFHTIHSSFTSFELDFLILFAIRPQGVVLASTVSMQVNWILSRVKSFIVIFVERPPFQIESVINLHTHLSPKAFNDQILLRRRRLTLKNGGG